MNAIIEILSTFFYIGYLPAGGTFASFACLPLVLLINKQNIIVQIVFIFLFTIFSIVTSSYAEVFFGKKDDRRIVIDEVVGMFVATFGINLKEVQIILLIFVVFRVLDISKIGIRKLQKINSGLGVVLDDFVAGILTNIIVRIISCYN